MYKLNREEVELIKEFENKAHLLNEDDMLKYAGYNSLQCAADDACHPDDEQDLKRTIKAIKAIINKAKWEKNLKQLLEFNDNETKENVLHIAMGSDRAFIIILNAIKDFPGLAKQLITAVDEYNDNVLHQMVEFGRVKSLIALQEAGIGCHEITDALSEAINARNKANHTPLELADTYAKEDSVEKAHLLEQGMINEQRLPEIIKQLPVIEEVLTHMHQTSPSSQP